MTSSPQTCNICDSDSHPFGSALVLSKYSIEYYRCTHCGFIQTEEPYWLEEAYSSAITHSDVGLVYRNMGLAPSVSLIIKLLFDSRKKFIDYGAGYGLFVRLMRDRGLDFFWHDPYCENIFAKHFEGDLSLKNHYELLTAFEVLEHLVDPEDELCRMSYTANSLLFSTVLVPDPAPPLDKWWYYGVEHGQHVSLFTAKALQILGQKLGLRFYTNGSNLHLLTSRRLNPLLFRFAASKYVGRLWLMWDALERNPSHIDADYQHVTGRSLRT